MDFSNRLKGLLYLNREELEEKFRNGFHTFQLDVKKNSSSQEMYEKAVALSLAILAVEDGHYYESEHQMIWSIVNDCVVSQMRYLANDIVQTDNLIGAMIQVEGLLDRISFGGILGYADTAYCYFLLNGGVTPKRKKLLDDLFRNL